ncbi:hypothetical protein BDP27DRAFT_1433219 [Rhodocollybia butyracea]|uniref:Uncharacterized protein n=1 Tax=Rhodocollybia butyracea TaxID=206335 RepID=A0A9P5P809_9AGAR|nr:hypothetical protein BDP27DRAFT_1433219 [Rhodocollybia butyracea]
MSRPPFVYIVGSKSVTDAGIPIPDGTVSATDLQLLLDQQKNPNGSINLPVSNNALSVPAPVPAPFTLQGDSLYTISPPSSIGAQQFSGFGSSGSGSLSGSTIIGGATSSPGLAPTGGSVEWSGPPTTQQAPLVNTPSGVDHSAPLAVNLFHPIPSTPTCSSFAVPSREL